MLRTEKPLTYMDMVNYVNDILEKEVACGYYASITYPSFKEKDPNSLRGILEEPIMQANLPFHVYFKPARYDLAKHCNKQGTRLLANIPVELFLHEDWKEHAPIKIKSAITEAARRYEITEDDYRLKPGQKPFVSAFFRG